MLRPFYMILLLIFSFINYSLSQLPKNDFFKGNWVDTVGYKGFVFPTDTLNIMDYGAKNNGVEITTQHIQATLDACAVADGGVVLWRTINSQFNYDDNKAPEMINSNDFDPFFTLQ